MTISIPKILSILLSLSIVSCSSSNIQPSTTQPPVKSAAHMQHNNPLVYPLTQRIPVTDDYFGTKVVDHFRWLEDDRSAATQAWVTRQNEVTFDYLSALPMRDNLAKRLTKLYDYKRTSMPFIEGDYTYFYQNDGLQNQAVLYRYTGNEQAEVFLDPNTFSEDGTVALSSLYFSEDGSLVCYLISSGGSDWRTAITIDTHTKKEVTARIHNIKFSAISWRENLGFYYASYDEPNGSKLSSKTDQHILYYHQIGTEQVQDATIFGDLRSQKHRYVGSQVTKDGRYLLVSAANSTSGNKLYLQDLQTSDNNLVAIAEDYQADSYLIDSDGETLFLETNYLAPNKRLVKAQVSNPQRKNWQDVIPQSEHVLTTTSGAGYFFAHYMIDAMSNVQQFDLTGKQLRQIELPSQGTVSGFSGKDSQARLYFSFTNYHTPSTIYALSPATGETTVFSQSAIAFDPQAYQSEHVFYSSKDGTRIPMTITYKKGLVRDGKTPTILYGYGGFDVSLQPSFSAANAAWLELGGIYAVANIRGGGEYGKTWHQQGIQRKKQNVFNDFIAAAEYLVAEQYTSPKRLAIKGGSNGGLLVAAVMLQRPELFQVALPAVGVLDMLRYHTFTSGAGWAYDYGTSNDNKQMFEYLYRYSPVHNVKASQTYPATLITTGDHDDRVVPAHSFKFAAALQTNNQQSNPTLIRIETNAGHGAGTPTSKIIAQYADIYAFTLYNMQWSKAE